MKGDLIGLWLENRPLKLVLSHLQEAHKRNLEYRLRLNGVKVIEKRGKVRYVI